MSGVLSVVFPRSGGHDSKILNYRSRTIYTLYNSVHELQLVFMSMPELETIPFDSTFPSGTFWASRYGGKAFSLLETGGHITKRTWWQEATTSSKIPQSTYSAFMILVCKGAFIIIIMIMEYNIMKHLNWYFMYSIIYILYLFVFFLFFLSLFLSVNINNCQTWQGQ